MHISTLFMLAILFMGACFGLIMAMDNTLTTPGPSGQTDTFGSSTTATTNGTAQVIVATNAYEARGQSLGAIMLACFVLLCIVLTFMAIYRSRSPNHGRYRT